MPVLRTFWMHSPLLACGAAGAANGSPPRSPSRSRPDGFFSSGVGRAVTGGGGWGFTDLLAGWLEGGGTGIDVLPDTFCLFYNT